MNRDINMRKKYFLVFTIFCILFHLPFSLSSKNKKPKPDKLLKKAKKYLNKIDSYQLIIIRKEWLVNKETYVKQKLLFKFKKPFQVYLKILEGPDKGVQLIYKRGWNDNKVKLKYGILSMDLKPDDSMLMKKNRHPIYESGLSNLLSAIMNDLKLAKVNEELNLSYKGIQKLYNKKCQIYIAQFPADKVKTGTKTRDKGHDQYYASKVKLWLDTKKGLPIRIKVWDKKSKLVEDYVHSEIKINNLTDKDFDPSTYGIY